MPLLHRITATTAAACSLLAAPGAQAYDLQFRQNNSPLNGTQLQQAFNRGLPRAYDQQFPDRQWTTYLLLDAPWLSDGDIAKALTRQDRRELDALVQPERWRREAEARAMANLPQVRYLEVLAQACLKRLPIQSASAAGDSAP